MIILKHDGYVYMAYCSGDIEPNAKDNLSMWRTGKNKQTLVGVFGSTRLADAIRYEKIVTNEFNKNNIVLYTAPLIQLIAERFDLVNDQHLSADVFLAKDDKVYQINSDGSVYAIESVYSQHFDTIMGIYDAEKVTDPEEFLKEAASRIEKTTGEVQFPLVIASTRSKDIKIITRETF